MDFPEAVDELSGIPLVGVWAGEMCSGAVSQGGEAWVWGRRVGPGRLERVDVTVPTNGDSDNEVEDCSEDIRLLALGEGHEMVVMDNDQAYVRGTSKLGSMFVEFGDHVTHCPSRLLQTNMANWDSQSHHVRRIGTRSKTKTGQSRVIPHGRLIRSSLGMD